MDATGDPTDGLRLDPDVVEVGRRELARIKAEFGLRLPRPQPALEKPGLALSPSVLGPRVDDLSVDRMSAEMAAAAERDHLVDRVRTLEAEVAKLREALASILVTAAEGVRPPTST